LGLFAAYATAPNGKVSKRALVGMPKGELFMLCFALGYYFPWKQA
jgi:hypothetical protein